jgi:acyl-CoA dehydrogenase
MTDLILTDDSKQYQDLARDFSQNEIAPRAEAFDHSGEAPKEIWKKVWEIGLANVQVPEASGGFGLSLFDATVVAEELGAGCLGITSAFWATDLAVAPLLVAGRNERLEGLMAEFSVAGYCVPNSSLKASGNGPYKVTGEAICINAKEAQWIVFSADTGRGAPTYFLVDKAQVKVAGKLTRIGLKAADIDVVQFENVSINTEDVIGSGEEFHAKVQTRTAVIIAAYVTGMARSAMEHAIKYSKERHTFGQPIGNHQGVAFMIADMAKNIEASRLMARKAAWLVDHNEGSEQLSLSAQHFALETAMAGATDAVQVFGGYGYSREYPVEKLMRDVKTLTALVTNPHRTKVECGKQLIAAAGSKK